MKNRAIIPLVIGLGVGLVAVKLSVDVVQKARAAGGNDDMLSVVVAQQMIPMGVEIKPAMLSVARSSKSLAPQGGFSDPEKLAGRVVRSPVLKGMPVIEEMLSAPGTPAGLSSLVPAGYRAVAVKVEEETSVAGFLKPGCRVDVVALLSVRGAKGGASQMISKVLLQDVTIGAVGQSLTGDAESSATLSRSVTLLVKPEEVPVLHLAATQGKIRLAMRHYDDMGANANGVARESELDPDARPQGGKPEESGFLSGLAGLFQPKQASGEAPKPAWVAEMDKKNEPVEVRPPFVMTLMQGSKVEAVAFENSSSMQRLDGARATAALAAAIPARSAVPNRATVAAAESPEEDVPTASFERGE
jgi:pilus assembly protein CpaB